MFSIRVSASRHLRAMAPLTRQVNARIARPMAFPGHTLREREALSAIALPRNVLAERNYLAKLQRLSFD